MLAPGGTTMAGPPEKALSGLFGPARLQHCDATAWGSSPTRPSAVGSLLKCGAIALIVGALVMVCASVGAFYQWKVSDNNVHNVHYNMRISGEPSEGSLQTDPRTPQESLTAGSGGEEEQEGEAVEVHDFQSGITALRFFTGDKCYIKPHIKAPPPDLGDAAERPTFDLAEGPVPGRSDQDSVIWVAADRPMQDPRFLSPKILALCGDAPVFWLHPTHPRDGERRKRERRRARRQTPAGEAGETGEGAAGQRNARGRTQGREGPGAVAPGEKDGGDEALGAVALGGEDGGEGGEGGEGGTSGAGSAYNPENPYHRKPETSGGSQDAATFDPMLDHLGICCAECRRSYTHCQRVCEPLRGYWPWPYNYAGCRVACRVILPCRWWVARMLGVV